MKNFMGILAVIIFFLATAGILTGVIFQIVLAYRIYGETNGQVITLHWSLSFFCSYFLTPIAWILGFICWRD